MRHKVQLQLEALVLEPSEEWSPRDNGWHIVRLSRGPTYWLGESGLLEVEPSEVLLLSPSRRGLLRASQLGPSELHYFRFCPDQLSGLLTLTEQRHLEQLTLKPRMVPIKLARNHPSSMYFQETVERAPKVRGLAQRGMLLAIVALSFNWDGAPPGTAERAYLPASGRLELLMGELTERDFCGLTAEYMAERCGCRTEYFKRLFQSRYGTSFKSRQLLSRLIMSKEWLTQTADPVRTIAKRAGFTRLSQFDVLFRREFGLSPAEYRRVQHLQNDKAPEGS